MKIKSMTSMVIAGLLLAGSGYAAASGDDYREGARGGSDVAAVDNQRYHDECGSCHFAYQPGLLPERSWRRLMETLDDHFGENAELAAEDQQALTEYLAANAGDHSNYRRSIKLMRSISSAQTPLRITDIPYFKREHREIPGRVIENKQVGSLSNCIACHRSAERGSYEERDINIPGYGRWED